MEEKEKEQLVLHGAKRPVRETHAVVVASDLGFAGWAGACHPDGKMGLGRGSRVVGGRGTAESGNGSRATECIRPGSWPLEWRVLGPLAFSSTTLRLKPFQPGFSYL